MRPLVIGALTVAGVALAAVGALTVVRGPGRAAREHALLLASAPGLREGGPVTYRGLDVGRIRTITLTNTGVLVTFGLERTDLVLRAADSARLATQGLLGDKVVDILPGDHRAGALPPGAMLPVRPLPELDAVAQLVRDLAACRDTSRRAAPDSVAAAPSGVSAVKRDT
jgi:ABC-type transporter Mla subunit MlaD